MPYATVTLYAGTAKSITVPTGVDPEGNTVTASFVGLVNSYTGFVSHTINWSPSFVEPRSTYTVTVKYFDGAITVSDTFDVNLINDPPLFHGAISD